MSASLEAGDQVVINNLPPTQAEYNGNSGSVVWVIAAASLVLDGKVWVKLPDSVREEPLLCALENVRTIHSALKTKPAPSDHWNSTSYSHDAAKAASQPLKKEDPFFRLVNQERGLDANYAPSASGSSSTANPRPAETRMSYRAMRRMSASSGNHVFDTQARATKHASSATSASPIARAVSAPFADHDTRVRAETNHASSAIAASCINPLPRSPSTPSGSAELLQVGSRVRVEGLQTATHWNGFKGRIISIAADRIEVEMRNEDQTHISVKPGNLILRSSPSRNRKPSTEGRQSVSTERMGSQERSRNERVNHSSERRHSVSRERLHSQERAVRSSTSNRSSEGTQRALRAARSQERSLNERVNHATRAVSSERLHVQEEQFLREYGKEYKAAARVEQLPIDSFAPREHWPSIKTHDGERDRPLAPASEGMRLYRGANSERLRRGSNSRDAARRGSQSPNAVERTSPGARDEEAAPAKACIAIMSQQVDPRPHVCRAVLGWLETSRRRWNEDGQRRGGRGSPSMARNTGRNTGRIALAAVSTESARCVRKVTLQR